MNAPLQPGPRRTAGLALALGASLLLVACSAVRVRPADPRQYDQRRRDGRYRI